MPNTKKISLAWSETGKTVYAIIRREADLFRLNDADGTFTAAPADPYLSLAEDAVIKGLYEVSEARAAWNNGNYFIFIYRQTGANPVPASDMMIGSSVMAIISDAEVVNVNVLTQSNIDFGALQKVSLNAATPASVQNIPATGSGFTALGDTRIANLDATISSRTKPADTQAAVTTVTNLTNAPTVGDLTDAMKVSVTAAVPAASAIKTTIEAAGGNLALILEDTGTTIPGTISTIQGNITDILADTGTTLDTLVKDIPTNTEFEARTLPATDYIVVTDTLARVTLVDTTTTNTDMRGTDNAGTATNLAIVDTVVDAIKLKTDTLGGAGAITWPYTLTDSVTAAPIDGAEVWVTTDSAGTNVIASGTTNDAGVVTFYLDAGTVYVWRKKAGYNFTNPDQETVV